MNSEPLEETLRESSRKLYKYIVVAIPLIAVTLYAFVKIVDVDLSVISGLKLSGLITILILLTLVPIVASLRFVYMANIIGLRDLKGGLITRIASQLAATFTPSTLLAHLVKAYWVKREGLGWDRGFGLSLADSFFDALTWNSIVIVLSIQYIAAGIQTYWFLFLVAIFSIVTYLIPFGMALGKDIRVGAVRFVNLIKIPLKEEEFENVGVVFLDIIRSPKKLSIVILLTLISLVYQSYIVVVIGEAIGIETSLLDSIVFFTVAGALKSTPVPAAVGLTELGLSLVAKGELILVWRILTLTYLTFLYLICFQIFSVKYIAVQKHQK